MLFDPFANTGEPRNTMGSLLIGHGNRAEGIPLNFSFPVIVYFDEDEAAWVGVSLLTCTTEVAPTLEEARDRVIKCLTLEVTSALEDTQGDVQAALRMILCDAEPQVMARYFAHDARELSLPMDSERLLDITARQLQPT